MENLLTRYRNVSILVGVLFLQVVGLAVQVKRSDDEKSTRLIRVWTVNAIAPFEKAIVGMQNGSSGLWHNYLYLRGVRQENRDLKQQLEHLRLEQVRLTEDAQQARRLQSLLAFKEQFVSKTVAAQVIGSSGSEQSRVIYLDKGRDDGIGHDMAVVTADGVVGKVLRSDGSVSQVLLINDQTSGVGAILEKSRLQGVLRGGPAGQVVLEKVLADEQVQVGEKILTSGGDQIFPKGLAVGTVARASSGRDGFLDIRVKPSANLSSLEEVLVITEKQERAPDLAETGHVRAADILSRRLPSVPEKPPVAAVPGGQPKVASEVAGAAPKPPAGAATQSAAGAGATTIMPRKAGVANAVPQNAAPQQPGQNPSGTRPAPRIDKPQAAPAQNAPTAAAPQASHPQGETAKPE